FCFVCMSLIENAHLKNDRMILKNETATNLSKYNQTMNASIIVTILFRVKNYSFALQSLFISIFLMIRGSKLMENLGKSEINLTDYRNEKRFCIFLIISCVSISLILQSLYF